MPLWSGCVGNSSPELCWWQISGEETWQEEFRGEGGKRDQSILFWRGREKVKVFDISWLSFVGIIFCQCLIRPHRRKYLYNEYSKFQKAFESPWDLEIDSSWLNINNNHWSSTLSARIIIYELSLTMIIINSGQWLSSLISKFLLVIHHKIAKRTCWTEQSEMQYSPFLRTKASAYVEWASIDCTSYNNDCQSGWVPLLDKTHHTWSSGIFKYVLRNLTIIVHWVRGFLRSNTAFKGIVHKQIILWTIPC